MYWFWLLLCLFGHPCQFWHILVSTILYHLDRPAYAWLQPTLDCYELHCEDTCKPDLCIGWTERRGFSWVVRLNATLQWLWAYVSTLLVIFLQTIIWQLKCYFHDLLAPPPPSQPLRLRLPEPSQPLPIPLPAFGL